MSGRYESRYLRVVDPGAPRGAWIRHTVLQRPGGAPAGSLWCTLWDAGAGPPVTVKATPALALPEGDMLRTGAARFAPDRVTGAIAAGPQRAAWDLAVHDAAPPLRHLPGPLYRAPLPRTKLESPAPLARLSGTVEAGGRRLAPDGWPGMTGHNWGSQHAERWLWLHAAFDDPPGAWLDLAAGRVRVAGATTPWIANGAYATADGRRHRLGGPRARPVVAARPGAAELALDDLRIRVTAPPGQTVAWVYADPPGGEHHALNCSIAALELTAGGRTLATAHGAVYELGVRERDHGVPVAPFPDP